MAVWEYDAYTALLPSVSASSGQALEGKPHLAGMRGREQQSPQPHPLWSWLSAGHAGPPGDPHGCRTFSRVKQYHTGRRTKWKMMG